MSDNIVESFKMMQRIEELSLEILRAKIQLDLDFVNYNESDSHVYELYEAIDEIYKIKCELDLR